MCAGEREARETGMVVNVASGKAISGKETAKDGNRIQANVRSISTANVVVSILLRRDLFGCVCVCVCESVSLIVLPLFHSSRSEYV